MDVIKFPLKLKKLSRKTKKRMDLLRKLLTILVKRGKVETTYSRAMALRLIANSVNNTYNIKF